MMNIIKTFSDKAGKSQDEVKQALEIAKSQVIKTNPEVDSGSERFYKLLLGELSKMLSIKSENEGADIGGIKYADIAPGTTAGLTAYHNQRRKLKKTVSEAFNKIASMSKDDLGLFNALQLEKNDLSISMLEHAISSNQLKESISQVKLGDITETSSSESLFYLDAAIKSSLSDKQNFASFVEKLTGHLLDAKNLNTEGFEYPGYDLVKDNTYISVKSSSSRRTITEAFRNSNSVKTSALILSGLHRMNPKLFRSSSNFSDINDLLEVKETLLEYIRNQKSLVSFSVSYINNNEYKIHITKPIEEYKILEHAFSVIENNTGKARYKFFASFNKLVEFCGGEDITIIKLMEDNEYSILRENIIETISNVKDYALMKKIALLLQ